MFSEDNHIHSSVPHKVNLILNTKKVRLKKYIDKNIIFISNIQHITIIQHKIL